MKTLQFFAIGHPAPGGSKTFFPVWRQGGQLVTEIRNGRVWPIIRVVDDAGEPNKIWKASVQIQARGVMQGKAPFAGAVHAEFRFFMKRPRNHYRTGKFAHILRDDAPKFHTVRPDALKLARSTEDACTGVLWVDDSANVKITSEKVYAENGQREGCEITVTFLLSDPPSPPSCVPSIIIPQAPVPPRREENDGFPD